MNTPLKCVIAALPIVGGCFLLQHLDHTASYIALAVTGPALALAWYSILDLQTKRDEEFWPHTVDRLMRATFTAITLVFVLNFVIPTPPPAQVTNTVMPVEFRQQRFVDDLNALVRDKSWDQGHLEQVVAAHFAKMNGKGELFLRLPDEKEFKLNADRAGVTVTLLR